MTPDSRLPGITEDVGNILWSCDIPKNTFRVTIMSWTGTTLDETSASPAALPPLPGRSDSAPYLISSAEGLGGPGHIYEGVQPPSFYHQPLFEVLQNTDSLDYDKRRMLRRDADDLAAYEFRTLYTKQVVLRIPTITKMLNDTKYLVGDKDVRAVVNATEIDSGQLVWVCEWEKTYLEGRVWLEYENDQSTINVAVASGNKAATEFKPVTDGTSNTKHRRHLSTTPKLHYFLREFRPTEEFLNEITGSEELLTVKRGQITCKKMVGQGKGALGPATQELATGNSRRDQLDIEERAIVADIVRGKFTRNIWRRDTSGVEGITLPPENDAGECSCEWKVT